MMFCLNMILSSILLSFVILLKCKLIESSETTYCEPGKVSKILLKSLSGSLRIKGKIDKFKGLKTECLWIIDTNDNSNANNTDIHLDINQLSIGENDNLIISDNESSIIQQFSGYQMPGIVLTFSQNITIQLSLSGDSYERKFDIKYKYDSNVAQLQNIKESGSYRFAYYNRTDGIETDFDLVFSIHSMSKRKNILINFHDFQLNGGTVSIENAINIKSDINYTTSPPFVLSNDRTIRINIRNFRLSSLNTGFTIDYDLVESDCSQYKLIAESETEKQYDIRLPDKQLLSSLSRFKCLDLFEGNETDIKFSIDLNGFHFNNRLDTITIFDGNSYYSEILAFISIKNYKDLNQYYLYSTSNKISVLYDSLLVTNRSVLIPPKVLVQSQGGTIRLNSALNSSQIIMRSKTNSFPVVFNIEVDEGFQAVLDLTDYKKSHSIENKTLAEIHYTLMKNIKPEVKLLSNNFHPTIIASKTNQMRLEFSKAFDFRAKVFQTERGCHSTASVISDSYSLSACYRFCSWFIPNRPDTNGKYILHFSQLNLQQKSDSLRIEKFGPQVSIVLKLNGPFVDSEYPDIYLDSSFSYVVYTERLNCNSVSNDLSQYLAISLIYVDNNPLNNYIDLNKNIQQIISPKAYPNFYSIGSDHIWTVRGNNDQKVLITFTDLDLISEHSLQVMNSNVTQTYTNGQSLSQTSDQLLSLPLFFNLSSHSISDKKPFNSRGFKANLTAVDCGYDIVIKQNEFINISAPNPMNTEKCIWTVTVTNDKYRLNLIQFSITSDIYRENSDLIIYDSNSLRNHNILNLDYFNENKSSSTNAIIIVYSVKNTGKKSSLSLRIGTTVCQNLCDNNERCLLDEFRCNRVNDCDDWSDEKWCNGTALHYFPTPEPNSVCVDSHDSWSAKYTLICVLCLIICLTIFALIVYKHTINCAQIMGFDIFRSVKPIDRSKSNVKNRDYFERVEAFES